MNERAAERADSGFEHFACINVATLYSNGTHHESGTQLEFSQGKTLRPGEIWLRLRMKVPPLTRVKHGFTQETLRYVPTARQANKFSMLPYFLASAVSETDHYE